MAWHFERVAGPFDFTEGPAWDGECLLFTDIPSNRILRYVPATGACDVYRTGTEGTNGLTFDRQGRLYGCQGRGRCVVRYEADGGVTMLADRYDGKRLNEPNDIVVDRQGRVWFTDPKYGTDRETMELDHESVYRLDPRSDGSYTITRVTTDTTRPNGLVLAPDERTLYVAESPRAPEGRRQLRAYPVNDDGSLGPMRIVYDFGDHRGIDGMRVDAAGNIVASCGWRQSGDGPRVAVFAPDGAVLEQHPTPSEPTNVCFGGPDLADLYVTGFDGALWRARTTRQGLSR
ncbi:MAG: SMP-30/gluconolactonase/LRE family protein [Chloroflexi bacterium]|nr:SMP-30/gluconolactonase/LRE family protein [Chloroflexota bacterium]